MMFEDADPYLARLREICLALPEAQEKVSHGRPNFFTKKVFAGYGAVVRGDHDPEPYARSLVFLPDAADRPALLADDRFFEPLPGALRLAGARLRSGGLGGAGGVGRGGRARRRVLPAHGAGPAGSPARRRRQVVSDGVARPAPPWHSQDGHVVRLEWGPTGAEALTRYAVASRAAVTAVVIDVLSFTTCVSVAADAAIPCTPTAGRTTRPSRTPSGSGRGSRCRGQRHARPRLVASRTAYRRSACLPSRFVRRRG
ncbi:hypothetical protein [Humibacillus xanthopallidus]|uniref:hypothetical protein n=1 Tax=Humibacillus xanthopallidus TaxID=412689 RepID=UPI002892E3D2|nr:hypothetical protein [Humibacillus xanthopallidus]